ncbi:MAG TPA: ribonuclease HII, partial [Novosphingobium capsulatum]|nr:ribonuclease HII [Novosphingobium capsulatum]
MPETPLPPASPASRPRGLIIGVDEAGRGPLAGPVVAGAVVL